MTYLNVSSIYCHLYVVDEYTANITILPADPTPAGPLSTAAILLADPTPAGPLSTAAIIGIAAAGAVILVVVLLLAVTVLLVRKHSHSKQTTGELYELHEIPGMNEPDEAYEANTHIATEMVPYMAVAEKVPLTIQNKAYAYDTDTEREDDVDEIYEIPDAIGMKELNKSYGTNTHFATTANEAYGREENVPYMPVAEMVPTIHNTAYVSKSGAAVNSYTEGEDDVDEIYEIPDDTGMKELSKSYRTNTHIAKAANEAYGRVRNIPVPYMPVAEMVPTIHNIAYVSMSEAAVNSDTEEQDDVDEMYEIEIPGMKEPNKAYGTNSHITTAANEAYGRVKDVPVAENMPEKVPNIQNKTFDNMSGAAVNTDTEEEDDVDEMYDYM